MIDGALVVFSSMHWRLNAYGGVEVAVTYDGGSVPAYAVLAADPDQVADACAAEIGRIGWAAQRQFGMKDQRRADPIHARLLEAVDHEHLSLIRIESN